MRVKSKQELEDLDMSLDLFDDSDWDFLGVDPKETKNFEYFNDIKDTDYLKPHSTLHTVLPIIVTSCLCIAVLGLGGAFALTKIGAFSGEVYNQQLASSEANLKVERVQGGTPVESDVSLEVTRVLTSYFTILQAKDSYAELKDYCKDTSIFNSTYNSFVEQMEVNYDTNDCFARAMRYFGGQSRISKVNEILEKDGVYYVYVDAYLPTDSSVTSYMRYNDYNISKHFTSTEVNEANMLMYFFELANTSQVTYDLQEYCIPCTLDENGQMTLVEDYDIANACTSAYQTVVDEMQKTIKNSLDL